MISLKLSHTPVPSNKACWRSGRVQICSSGSSRAIAGVAIPSTASMTIRARMTTRYGSRNERARFATATRTRLGSGNGGVAAPAIGAATFAEEALNGKQMAPPSLAFVGESAIGCDLGRHELLIPMRTSGRMN